MEAMPNATHEKRIVGVSGRMTSPSFEFTGEAIDEKPPMGFR